MFEYFAYFDEAGNTGGNFLHPNQPVYVVGGWILPAGSTKGAEHAVQVTRERSLELALADGEDIFVTPRDLKVFHDTKALVDNYVI